jgi:hypothetical protein
MALDEGTSRLFVGCRRPAQLAVVDVHTGKPVTSVEIVGDTDDLFYDAAAGASTSSAATDSSMCSNERETCCDASIA